MNMMLGMKILTVLGTIYCGIYPLSHLRAKKILSYFPKVDSKLGKEFKLNQVDKNGNVIRDSSGKPKVSNKLTMTIRRVNTKKRNWIEHHSTKIKDDNKIIKEYNKLTEYALVFVNVVLTIIGILFPMSTIISFIYTIVDVYITGRIMFARDNKFKVLQSDKWDNLAKQNLIHKDKLVKDYYYGNIHY